MSRLRRTIWTCAVLGGMTLATFWPALHNDFIALDDRDYVVYNPQVNSGLSWQNAVWAFQTGSRGNWHPLTWLSHMLDVQCFGLAPAGHHLTNLLLHTANALLLFLLLRRLTGAHWRSAFVAALFAVHPLHVESVVWVAERKDVLSTFFFLLTLHAYARYVLVKEGDPKASEADVGEETFQGLERGTGPSRAGSWNAPTSGNPRPRASVCCRPALWYGMMLTLFVFGLMSKAMLVTLPCVLLLLDYWPLRRLDSIHSESTPRRVLSLLTEKFPFFALALGASIVVLLTQGSAQAVLFRLPVASRCANAIASYWRYLGKMIWPVDLGVLYPLPKALFATAHPCFNWRFGVGVFALGAVSVAVVLLRRRRPWLFVGWFWYLGTLVPVIGLIQVGSQTMADRYTYVPLIGIFLCIAWSITELAIRSWPVPVSSQAPPEPPLGLPNAPATAVQPGGAAGLNSVVGSAAPALQATLAIAALLLLAACVLRTRTQVGYWRNTLTLFERTLAVAPDNNATSHFLVASALVIQGDLNRALPHFKATLETNPGHVNARYWVGKILEGTGHPDQAAEQYQIGLELTPKSDILHHGLGRCLWKLGQREQALEHYAEALRLNSNLTGAQLNLADALADLGRWEAAAPHFAKVVELDPANALALSHLAEILVRLGRPAEAETRFDALVRLCPTNAQAHINLGTLLWRRSQRDLAAQHFADAARLAPNEAMAFFNLGAVLSEQGKLDQAIAAFNQALRLQPDYFEARAGLGRAFAAAGKFDDAQAQLRQALRLCPTNASLQLSLGQTLMFLGQTNQAAAPFAEALRLKPTLPAQTVAEGKALAAQRQFHLACARFNTALWLQPQNVEALNGLAWILATHPQPAGRNGPEAIRLAERACQLTEAKDPQFLATLAAAYAEAGRFAEAITTADKARDLALATGQKELAHTAESGLALYRKQQAFHQ